MEQMGQGPDKAKEGVKVGAEKGIVSYLEGLLGGKKKEVKGEPSKLDSPEIESYYYQIYRGEETVKLNTFYEKFIRKIPKDLILDSDLGFGEILKKPIEDALIVLSPAEIASVTIYVFLLSLFVSFGFIVLIPPSPLVTGVAFVFPLMTSGLILGYPFLRAKMRRMQIVGQGPLSILYLVISLRVVPNLESAISFAAQNMPDPIGNEFRQILWHLQLRTQTTASDAIYSYAKSIKGWAPGFSDGLYLVASSINEPTEKLRIETLEKAINIVLTDTQEIMNSYARGLSMPVTIVNAMAIILPVLGLVMAPVASVFMADTGNIGLALALVYDFFLPFTVLILVLSIVSGRPGSFSRIDFSLSKEVPPWNTFYYKDDKGKITEVPIVALSLLVLLLFSGLNIYAGILSGGAVFSPSIPTGGEAASALSTLPMVLGFGLSIGLFCFLNAKARSDVRDRIREMEREFTSALYQLGNVLDQGEPLESAFYTTGKNLEGTETSKFFMNAVRNIRQFGMPPKRALFDEKYGAILMFPSSLIRNIMHVIMESSIRGPKSTAMTAMSISSYLKNLQEVQSKVEDTLAEEVTTMKFQGFILIPVISGIVVGLSQLITSIVVSIAEQITDVFSAGGAGMSSNAFVSMLNVSGAIQPSFLQLTVGFFSVMMISLVGYFSGALEAGPEDLPSILLNVGTLVIIGTIAYTGTTFIVTLVFSAMTSGLLS
jgi:Flp pilus assembly protein TadB